MTKRELIERISGDYQHRDMSKAAAADLVQSLFDNLSLALRRGRRFNYPGFGTFIVRRRKERKGHNPKTGEVMTVRASKMILFRPATTIKEELN